MSDEEMKDFLRMRLQPKSSYELPPVERRKLLRQAFGLSQRELGEQIGVSDASISTWESGKSTPRGEARKRYIAFCRAAEEVLTELEQKEGGANDDESSEEEG
ncbi:helix-turn-helix transcriptional regulator [Streptomyces sp. NPDC048324]|uniref:helix-turn-helix domain-containing protein n=1 Tax=Streptomyces sp. NPDC048324 TaxID=3157205 RepID=UPI0034177AB0